MTRVKICGVRTVKDLSAAAGAGADAVGFLVGQRHVSEHFISAEEAAVLAEKIPPFVTGVLVTHLTGPEEVADLLRRTGLRTVQLHGGSTAEEIRELRRIMAEKIRIIAAVHLQTCADLAAVLDRLPDADAILLDSMDAAAGKVGGTGLVCDWGLAADFTMRCPLPVILAGGLRTDNAAEAVRSVRPYGVDANTGLKNESGAIDPELAEMFCRNVKMIKKPTFDL